MEWTADVTAGAWLTDRLDSTYRGSMHSVVPRGFPTYTRVFHPALRDRPVGVAWPPAGASPREWQRFQQARPEVDAEHATWGEAARSLGTTMHRYAQWHGLTHDADDPRDAAGWRWHAPAEGRLESELLAALAEDLRTTTTTPDDVCVAVWEGWGGLVGSVGFPRRGAFPGTDDEAPQHTEMLRRSIPNVIEEGYRTPTWQSGTISDEASRGPRLRLPQRDHVLFRGRLDELAGPMPWDGDTVWSPSPSLVWPADHAWVIVTEIDFDSTIVAGSASVAALLADDPRLETAEIGPGADLTWDSDGINR